MKNENAPFAHERVIAARLAAFMLVSLIAFATASRSRAADLTKADNSTDLGTAGAYTDTEAVPTSADTLVFDDTLTEHVVFSWTGNRSVKGIRLADPSGAVTINLAGASYDFNNSAGTVIDMSAATADLTIAATSAGAAIRVRGSTAGGATIAVADGRTLTIQSKLFYNNVQNGTTSTLHVTGAGNLTVDGANGQITDKNTGTGTLTALSLEGAGTVTLSGANGYSGGTSLTGGTLVVGADKALGDGEVTVSDGTLDLNGAGAVNLTLAAGKDFALSGGTLKLDLGTGADQITGSGVGRFDLSGGTIAIGMGDGFSYGMVYQVFSGFDAGTSVVGDVTFTGFDTSAYQASLNTLGQLSFSAIPEPATCAVIAAGLVFGCALVRRRRVSPARARPGCRPRACRPCLQPRGRTGETS